LRACRTASVIATAALLGTSAIAACREAAIPEIPPVTSAHPDASSVLGSSSLTLDGDGSSEAGAGVLMVPLTTESPIKASFVDVPGKVEAPVCSRVLIAVAKGKVTAFNETLNVGDVLVLTHPEAISLQGTGLVVVARRDFDSPVCSGSAKPPASDKKVVRANAAPKLEWAGGAMSAHLDVGTSSAKPDASLLSPDVYLGRLEGTGAVAEHIHAASWEILAAVEANGTFVLDGTEGHLGPRQIVMVPPGAKHAWKPAAGSKLVAIQMYSPPGPEQRFITLAAADKDVKDAGVRDAR
jgi:mannose-6-phosphate isomerase-like protein (cupin superfamily)